MSAVIEIFEANPGTRFQVRRMESHGLPGEIQISEEVKLLIGDQFILQERGTVEVKGKGIMKTYFVEGISVRK